MKPLVPTLIPALDAEERIANPLESSIGRTRRRKEIIGADVSIVLKGLEIGEMIGA